MVSLANLLLVLLGLLVYCGVFLVDLAFIVCLLLLVANLLMGLWVFSFCFVWLYTYAAFVCVLDVFAVMLLVGFSLVLIFTFDRVGCFDVLVVAFRFADCGFVVLDCFVLDCFYVVD